MNIDIFNRKKIRELEERSIAMEIERNKYRNMVAILDKKLDTISIFEEIMPKDCTRGPWCAACEFGKVISYFDSYNPDINTRTINKIYVCGKGESCKNFVKKDDETDFAK